MRRLATVLMLLVLFTGTSYAEAPLNGDYQSTDLGGPLLLGRYTEGWAGGGGALDPGTTLNAESWDGSTLGTQWKYWCSTSESDAVLLTDNVNTSGNGNRTYMKTFVGDYIWLSGTGPWANGDPEYLGTIEESGFFTTPAGVFHKMNNWVAARIKPMTPNATKFWTIALLQT